MRAKPLALVAAAILMTLFIAGVIVLADTTNLGFLQGVYDIPYGDKAGHLLLYGLLSFLVNLAVLNLAPSQPPERLALLTSTALAIAVSLEEFSQIWLPSRSPDWFDLLASFTGLSAFAALALLWTTHSRGRTPAEVAQT